MSLNSAMYIGATGLNTYSTALQVVSDNIANSNTTAYKANEVRFGDMVSGYMPITTKDSDHMGAGVSILGNFTDFSQGSISSTSNWSDLAIDGNGYFRVSDINDAGRTVGQTYLTRDGSFHVNSDGYLVNNSGLAVLNADLEPIKVMQYPDDPEYDNMYVDSDGQIYGTRIRTVDLESTENSINKKTAATLSDSTLSQASGDPVTLSYEAAAGTGDASSVTVKIYDKDGNAVRTETINSTVADGATETWSWDGLNDAGEAMSPYETYTYEVSSPEGNVSIPTGDSSSFVLTTASVAMQYEAPSGSGDASSVTINVYDPSGTLVRTQTISGTLADGSSGTWNWNGLDDSGNPLPAGTGYTYTVSSPEGNVDIPSTASGTFNLTSDDAQDDNVSFTLTQDSYVAYEVYDSDGNLVKTIDGGIMTGASAGTTYNSQAIWDGTDENGDQVAPGSYTVKVNTSPVTGGVSTVDYNLLTDADVTFKVYDSDGTLVNTATITGQTAGNHSWSWNGKDSDGNPVAAGTYTYEVSTSKDDVSEAIDGATVHVTVVSNEDGLVREGTNLFSMSTEAGAAVDSGESWENTVGTVTDYSLESSNVDLATEMVNMIIYQSTYNANSKSITTASGMIDTTINLIR